MSQQDLVYLKKDELTKLIKDKLTLAGLSENHADEVAQHLAYADSLGIHSHGAVRVEYYAERISKGGSNTNPNFVYEQTGPCSGVYDGDNAVGFVVAKNGIEKAIDLAKENGIGIVGMKNMGHCGTLSYYLELAAEHGLIAISMCQSDPMVVPFGGIEPYFGTNPIGFAAPSSTDQIVVFDMATTVQAWGKVLDARAKNVEIPDTWAVDKEGNPTKDPFKVNALVPIAGPKGYGLMMMVDILAGSLLGVKFGKNVSSMYADLSKGRGLGQIHMVINPEYFGNGADFKENISQMIDELHQIKPAQGFTQVLVPGEPSKIVAQKHEESGIPIVKEIYDYLVSTDVHYNNYDHQSAFASK